MSKLELKAASRELVGKKTKNLRKNNQIPASVYGPTRKSENIIVDNKDFHRIFKEAGFTSLIDMNFDGTKSKVLVKEAQQHPITGEFYHISFYQVDDKTTLTAEVPVKISGESPAVKLNKGFLTTPVHAIMVRCLPNDLPHELVIDISVLAEIGDTLTIGSIQLPAGVELHSSMQATTALATIQAPQKQLEVEAEKTEEGAAAEGSAEGADGEAKPADNKAE